MKFVKGAIYTYRVANFWKYQHFSQKLQDSKDIFVNFFSIYIFYMKGKWDISRKNNTGEVPLTLLTLHIVLD